MGTAYDRSNWPRAQNQIQKGNKRMAKNSGMERRLEAGQTPREAQSSEAGRDAQPSRGDLPDWLARQLFRIFV